MVLQGQPCGRVGRCRGFEGSIERSGPLLFFGACAVFGAFAELVRLILEPSVYGVSMRSFLFVVIASLLPAVTAWPCARPPPMRSELTLVTAADATLPADGAILVTRHDAPIRGSSSDGDEHWTINDGDGHDVTFTVEDLGSSVERWVPKGAADRDLVIVDEAGKEIAKLHQTKASSGKLAAPKPRSLTSTTSMDDARRMPSGVPGGTTKLELAADPPAEARFLAIAITGHAARVHSSVVPTAAQRIFKFTSYSHKSCMRGGPAPIFIGERVGLTWIDGLGRRSAVAQVTATKQR